MLGRPTGLSSILSIEKRFAAFSRHPVMSRHPLCVLSEISRQRIVLVFWGMTVTAALLFGSWLADDQGFIENKSDRLSATQPQAADRPGAALLNHPAPPEGNAFAGGFRQRFMQARDVEALRAIARDMILSNSEANLRVWAELLLAERDPARRAALLEALDVLSDEGSIEMITQLISLTDEGDVNAALARTLSRAANPDTLQHLTEIYAESMPGSRQRERVLELIAGVTNPYAIPGLVNVAGNPSLDKEITERAITSLSKIGDESALEGLVKTYESWPSDSLQRKDVLKGIASSYNDHSRPYLENLAASSPVPEIVIAAKKALKNLVGDDLKASD